MVGGNNQIAIAVLRSSVWIQLASSPSPKKETFAISGTEVDVSGLGRAVSVTDGVVAASGYKADGANLGVVSATNQCYYLIVSILLTSPPLLLPPPLLILVLVLPPPGGPFPEPQSGRLDADLGEAWFDLSGWLLIVWQVVGPHSRSDRSLQYQRDLRHRWHKLLQHRDGLIPAPERPPSFPKLGLSGCCG